MGKIVHCAIIADLGIRGISPKKTYKDMVATLEQLLLPTAWVRSGLLNLNEARKTWKMTLVHDGLLPSPLRKPLTECMI